MEQLNEEDYKPYWDDSCEMISSHLLPYNQINSATLDNNPSKTVENSWFQTERKFHQNTNLQSYISSFVESSILEDTQIKSRKIRIYLTQQQKILFKQWFGVARKFYNETLTIYKNGSEKTWDKVYQDIAKQNEEHGYIKSVPYQIKKIAVKDYREALSINKKIAKRSGKPFEMKFKSKKNPK